MSVLIEQNKKRTGLRWKARPPRKLKFVDYGLILAKINMDSADIISQTGGGAAKSKHDLQSQNLFRRIVSRAESRAMVVNKSKTKPPADSKMLTETPCPLGKS